MPQTAVAPPTQPTYLPYQFKCNWVNKSNIEKDLPEADLPASTFTILDPRVYHTMTASSETMCDAPWTANISSSTFDTSKSHTKTMTTTNEELGRYKFSASLKSVSSEVDIFELFIPVGLESRYSVNPDGQVQRPEEGDQSAPAIDNEAETQELSPATDESQGQLSPDDFFPVQYDVDELGSDKWTDSYNPQRCAFQGDFITKVTAGLRAETTMDILGEIEAQALRNVSSVADARDMRLSAPDEWESDPVNSSQIRGGETHVSPDYGQVCVLLKLDEKIPVSRRAISNSNKPGYRHWLDASSNIGELECTDGNGTTIDLHHIKMNGGILGDDMGMGKTIIICAFLTYVTQHHKSEDGKYKPILILVPNTVIYQWMDELLRWTKLKTYLYYGKK
ncbi:ATP-dependent helicase smarcad1 [Exophiala xenobiotica]|nr:ATP-dependent helicase smarcad1 [Exophiala xenobiotica]KAK5233822.1 ATP-dependent helicase smarcad1 [Exophiala xenobiotica]KAK5250231.1 ATP-dependent helicase smarcad1 [Exophiala xenobiotica]KAK5258576.1 hypothetical protein LTR40_007630 [Exophiala xenobiotica]KAK5326796.1 ATP-dependent helicase smarcad1 [Exophiala xenobiotica]